MPIKLTIPKEKQHRNKHFPDKPMILEKITPHRRIRPTRELYTEWATAKDRISAAHIEMFDKLITFCTRDMKDPFKELDFNNHIAFFRQAGNSITLSLDFKLESYLFVDKRIWDAQQSMSMRDKETYHIPYAIGYFEEIEDEIPN